MEKSIQNLKVIHLDLSALRLQVCTKQVAVEVFSKLGKEQIEIILGICPGFLCQDVS